MSIPTDPMILLSFLNTKLRDFHPSLDDLCSSLQLDRSELTKKMASIGYEYDASLNRFVSYRKPLPKFGKGLSVFCHQRQKSSR